MGYSTSFTGQLSFTKELKASELAELRKFLEEDCRDHPEWKATHLSYIDLQLTKDFTGIEWNGAEKTYDLVEKINVVIEQMRKRFPDFELTGTLLAQGEEIGDVWKLVIENNEAVERKIDLSHKKKIKCPHCEEEFFLEDTEDDIKDSVGKKCVFLFSGFRNEELSSKVINEGYAIAEDFSKQVTHLVMKNVSADSTKKQKAQKQGCKIWSKEQLEEFLNDK